MNDRLRIEQLRVQNYRVLRDVTFKALTPLTVLCGANGSGKSTVFDVFAFLHEAFTRDLRSAWDDRNRIDAIRSRGHGGPVSFEIEYRAADLEGVRRLVTYQVSIDQEGTLPFVVSETLRWSTAPAQGRPREILNFERGEGRVYDEENGEYEDEVLASPDLLAVSTLGQLRSHPRVMLLRDFIQGWYLSYVTAGETRSTPRSGPEPRLAPSGDNLANVIQYLQEEHPDRLNLIFTLLSERVPQLEHVLPERLADGRLLLQLKDKPFSEPVLSRFASDGTLKLLAYLTVLHGPTQPEVINRHRGAGEPAASATGADPRRGDQAGVWTVPGAGDHALSGVPQRDPTQGAVDAQPRGGRLHCRSPVERGRQGDGHGRRRRHPRSTVDRGLPVDGRGWSVILMAAGHHRGGLAKARAAADIAAQMNIESNVSRSFQVFRDGLRFLVQEPADAQA